MAPNVRQQALDAAFDPIIYVPFDSDPGRRMALLVRSALEPSALTSLLRQEMLAIDPDLPLFDIRTFDEQLSFDLWAQRFTSALFSIFAGVAMALAAVGLYAATAYSAGQRSREIGVRVALGARRTHVWWLVTRGAARQLGPGLVLGIAGGIAASRVLPEELGRASGTDPVTLAAVAVVLRLIGLVATSIPANAAAGVDPAVTLRSDG